MVGPRVLAAGRRDRLRIRGGVGARPIGSLTERLEPISDREFDPRADLLGSRLSCGDDAFCDTATQIGRALLERDAAALLRLSRSDTIECARVARQFFPGCADADVLTGYGLSSAEVVSDLARALRQDRVPHASTLARFEAEAERQRSGSGAA